MIHNRAFYRNGFKDVVFKNIWVILISCWWFWLEYIQSSQAVAYGLGAKVKIFQAHEIQKFCILIWSELHAASILLSFLKWMTSGVSFVRDGEKAALLITSFSLTVPVGGAGGLSDAHL